MDGPWSSRVYQSSNSVWVQTKVDVIHQFLQRGDIQSRRSPGCVIQKFKLNEKVLEFGQFFSDSHLQ